MILWRQTRLQIEMLKVDSRFKLMCATQKRVDQLRSMVDDKSVKKRIILSPNISYRPTKVIIDEAQNFWVIELTDEQKLNADKILDNFGISKEYMSKLDSNDWYKKRLLLWDWDS